MKRGFDSNLRERFPNVALTLHRFINRVALFVVAQAWARNIVRNFSGLGLDRDFFIALAAGILLYTACASLLLSIRSSFLEQTEKYSSSFFTNQKQS